MSLKFTPTNELAEMHERRRIHWMRVIREIEEIMCMGYEKGTHKLSSILWAYILS